jgi:hypothetical protein
MTDHIFKYTDCYDSPLNELKDDLDLKIEIDE